LGRKGDWNAIVGRARALCIEASVVVNHNALKSRYDNPNNPTQAWLLARHLELRDGASLTVTVRYEWTGNSWVSGDYAFHYQRPDGWFFRYDRDAGARAMNCHETCHLHVDSKSPRFITHEIAFEDVLAFVDGCLPATATA